MTPNSYRLLVIEDSDADVFLIRKALVESRIPAAVQVCSDGEAALRVIGSAEAAEIPDAIVLDLALPRVPGIDVLRNLSKRPAFAGVPVMVFTSSPSPADRHQAEMAGRVRYVQKPTGLNEFLHAVSENVKAMLSERGSGSAPPQ